METISEINSSAGDITSYGKMEFFPLNPEEVIFSASIKGMIEKGLEKNGLAVIYSYSNDENICPDNTMDIYKITGEILNNIVKYSGADFVKVFIKVKAKSVIIEVDDNGTGFDMKKTVQKNEGMGLERIIRRVELLNGSVTFFSNSDRTVVYVEIPLEVKNE